MFDELRIRNLGIIDDVTLRLAPGLNVLTGETGAGKTMVVSAVELLLGARADADRVRGGRSAALVEGRLHPAPAAAAQWLDGDEDLVVSREVVEGADGTRSRARVGGRLASASALAELMTAVVELHGQSDSTRLGDPAVQRELLDRSGGPELAAARAAYGQAYAAWQKAAAELDALSEAARDRARELDRVRFELAEIDAVAPAPGEDATLDREIAILAHAEALLEAGRAAAAALTAEGAARDALGSCVAALRAVADVDPGLDALRARAEGLAAEVQDLALDLERQAERTDLDPARLQALRERRVAIAGLARKYGPDSDAILTYAEDARARSEALAGGEERASALREDVARLRSTVDEAATDLSAARRAAAERLVTDVERHLADLALEAARLLVEVEPTAPGPHGADRVAFHLVANPGEPALPLAKAASGGERSRIALALRLALADADDTPVLVFDEVDAGIGGQVAVAVGRKLARLADGRQVLCVTHLAQLAAFADAHFGVEKAVESGGRTVARVTALDDDARLAELSRMLSGSDSALAAQHAAELVATAQAARTAR
jgi:DNA repair protein RecN (Recombination protein N)